MLEVPWTQDTMNDAQLEAAILAIHAERQEEEPTHPPIEAESQALSSGSIPAWSEAIGPGEAASPLESQEVSVCHCLTPLCGEVTCLAGPALLQPGFCQARATA